MRVSMVVVALSATPAFGYPWLAPNGIDALLNHPEARQEIERRLDEYRSGKPQERDLFGGILGGLGSLLGGTLEAVFDNVLGIIPTAEAVNGLKKFPERESTISSNLINDKG
jgi:hypothetical protein